MYRLRIFYVSATRRTPAIDWDAKKRRPSINDECVGCHLCLNVCPVQGCITPGEIKWKEGRKPVEVALKHNYE
jgi:dihydropyrimidine dehydrogenase (NAD+) subunit PreA